jgi:30S ribosomal protein S31
MGKGDKRTRRGKIVRGTFGVKRPKFKAKKVAATSAKKAAPAKKKAK